ncbi:hypothetical protein GDO81_026543 [Engystomops pustulosus]|uniref:Uncharacterized protein n=1 Tax=Engystomops pustulosus TaxID=76066 RepID=A0AAV6ZUJ4_ENGPU|nr:hypothetical protein GDO81_026543 [Engystomops pustulosus]
MSGCGCLFLHGGVGVCRRTQGPVQGGHDGGPPPITSPDGSSRRDPPERCPRPPDSQDWPGIKQEVPPHHQVGEAEICVYNL